MPEPARLRAPEPRRRTLAAPPPTDRLAEGALWFVGILLALLLLALLLPEPAGAQITTGLRPPERVTPAQQLAQTESTIVAVRDSAAREERLDLRAWVDSAAMSLEAGAAPVTPMPDVPGDSLVPDPGVPAPGIPAPVSPTPGTPTPGTPTPGTPTPGTPAPGTPAPGTPAPGTPAPAPRPSPPPAGGGVPAPGLREGARAPDTATPLPLLAAVGGVMVGAGIWLRRRR